MQIHRKLMSKPLGLALASVFLLAACGGNEEQSAAGAAGQPAPAVTVLAVQIGRAHV